MAWLGSFVAKLDDHIGGAPMALVEAIDAVGVANAEQTQLIANKAAVVALLAEREGKAPAPDAQRARIKMINDAAKAIGREALGGKAPFAIKSRKNEFVALRPDDWRDNDAEAMLTESSRIDAESAPDEIERPSIAALPHHIVFVSHGHENAEVEKVVLDFADGLGAKFQHLPQRYKGKFTVEVWIDHRGMRGPDEYRAQADEVCPRAAFGLFLLSDKWYGSEPCQNEALHFGYPNPGPKRRFFSVQLSGRLEDGDPDLAKAPCYPRQWNQKYPNLLQLWSQDIGDRDAFLTKLRNDICAQIDAGASPPPGDRKAAATSAMPADRHRSVQSGIERSAELTRFEPVIVDGQVENPALTQQEGGSASEDAIKALTQWACEPASPNRIFALLGSFGSGKTTTSQLLVREMLRRRMETPREFTPLPVYLDLRRAVEFYEHSKSASPNLGELIRLSLHDDVRDELDGQQLLAFLRKEPCLVLFDGLDEVGTRIGPERLAALYRAMLELVPPEAWKKDRASGKADWAACPTRLMVTCRTHFFRDNLEQASTLASNDRHAGLAPKQGYKPVETRYMAPFRPEQIRSYFIKILGDEKGEAAWRSIERIEDLGELAQKPIMARYMAELADELVADAAAGREVNAARLYDLLFRKAMLRDADKRPMLSVRDREKLLEELAEQLWLRQRPQLRADELEDWFDGYIAATPSLTNMARDKPDMRNLLMTELRNASMLVRAGDDVFGFVHSSFQEYFLARRLLDDLREGRLAARTAMPAISEETIAFLLDLVAINDDWRKIGGSHAQLFAAGNDGATRLFALRLGLAIRARGRPFALPEGADLSGLDLRDLTLEAMALRGVDLRGANMLAGAFTDILFVQCDFGDTNIGQGLFERCRFIDCRGPAQGVAAARLHECDIDTLSNERLFSAAIFVSAVMPAVHRLRDLAVSPSGPAAGASMNDAGFSPDGQRIVTACSDNFARLWDAASGVEQIRFEGHEAAVMSARFSPDGQRIVTASYDKSARLWDAASGAELIRLDGHQAPVWSAEFSPDGRRIVTASDDKSARLWDAASGAELIRLDGHRDDVLSAQFSPDGRQIVTASEDNSARLWDSASGAELLRLEGHQDAVMSAQFSPDGRRIVTASYEDGVRIWDAVNGAELLRLEGHQAPILNAQFSPDGQRIVTASFENAAWLWDAENGAELIRLEGHQDSVISAQFSPDGQRIATASLDNSARLWDAVSGAELLRLVGHEATVRCAQFSPDGQRIVVASEDDSARLWDATSGAELIRLEHDQATVWSAAFSPDGHRIVTASDDNSVRLWDAASGAELLRLKGHQDWVMNAQFSPDGQSIVTASYDNSALLWDAASGTELVRLVGHEATVRCAQFSPDGQRIVTASDDNSARLWDATNGAELVRLEGHQGVVLNAQFSSNGQRIVTASVDNSARLWDAASGGELICLEGHQASVRSAQFSPDRQRVITASDDNSARLWDVTSGAELIRFEGHQAPVRSAQFSPDGQRIATASNDSSTRLWDAASGRLLATRYQFADSWWWHDEQSGIERFGPNAWKYLHGIETCADGSRRVVNLWDHVEAV